MKNIDWGLVQVQFEVFGATPDELANEYDTTPRMIEYAIQQRGWKQLPVAMALQDWTEIDDVKNVSDELLEEVQRRQSILRSIKTSALAPRYMAVETAILGKALELLQNLSFDDPYATPKLKAVADILKTLKDQNGMTATSQNDKAKSIKVNVVTKAGGSSPSQVQAGCQVVIEDSGGHAVAPCDDSPNAPDA